MVMKLKESKVRRNEVFFSLNLWYGSITILIITFLYFSLQSQITLSHLLKADYDIRFHINTDNNNFIDRNNLNDLLTSPLNVLENKIQKWLDYNSKILSLAQ